jgi:hypothetical protein
MSATFVRAGEVHDAPNKARHGYGRPRDGERRVFVSRPFLDTAIPLRSVEETEREKTRRARESSAVVVVYEKSGP